MAYHVPKCLFGFEQYAVFCVGNCEFGAFFDFVFSAQLHRNGGLAFFGDDNFSYGNLTREASVSRLAFP